MEGFKISFLWIFIIHIYLNLVASAHQYNNLYVIKANSVARKQERTKRSTYLTRKRLNLECPDKEYYYATRFAEEHPVHSSFKMIPTRRKKPYIFFLGHGQHKDNRFVKGIKRTEPADAASATATGDVVPAVEAEGSKLFAASSGGGQAMASNSENSIVSSNGSPPVVIGKNAAIHGELSAVSSGNAQSMASNSEEMVVSSHGSPPVVVSKLVGKTVGDESSASAASSGSSSAAAAADDSPKVSQTIAIDSKSGGAATSAVGNAFAMSSDGTHTMMSSGAMGPAVATSGNSVAFATDGKTQAVSHNGGVPVISPFKGFDGTSLPVFWAYPNFGNVPIVNPFGQNHQLAYNNFNPYMNVFPTGDPFTSVGLPNPFNMLPHHRSSATVQGPMGFWTNFIPFVNPQDIMGQASAMVQSSAVQPVSAGSAVSSFTPDHPAMVAGNAAAAAASGDTEVPVVKQEDVYAQVNHVFRKVAAETGMKMPLMVVPGASRTLPIPERINRRVRSTDIGPQKVTPGAAFKSKFYKRHNSRRIEDEDAMIRKACSDRMKSKFEHYYAKTRRSGEESCKLLLREICEMTHLPKCEDKEEKCVRRVVDSVCHSLKIDRISHEDCKNNLAAISRVSN